MIFYTSSVSVLVNFITKANRTNNELFADLWREAGGKISQEEEVDLVQMLDDKQQEIESAREMIELQQAALIEKNRRIETLEQSNENLYISVLQKDTAIHNLRIENRKDRNDSDFKESLAKTAIAQYLDLIQRQQNTIDFVVVENSKLITRTERMENTITLLRREIEELNSDKRQGGK